MNNTTLHTTTELLQTYQSPTASTALYFAPLLPWQHKPWVQLTANVNRMAHGILFSGMQGIGKHAFVWHLTAWLLCDNVDKDVNKNVNKNGLENNSLENKYDVGAQVACGQCQSCLWLKAGTHPNLKVIPQSSALLADESTSDDQSNTSKTKQKSKAKSKKNKTKKSNKPAHDDEFKAEKIKIEDIRNLTPFVSKSSRGKRICIIDNADNMTIAAANALLKTLEEPHESVHLFLLSNMPAKLLPTIRSRLQKAPIDSINSDVAQRFLQQAITNQNDEQDLDATQISTQQVSQLLSLASGAPLAALALIKAPWYDKRKLWLTTWLALRVKKRTTTAASDYWQQQLSLTAYMQLTEIMLMDVKRIRLGLEAKQQDLGFDKLESIATIPFERVQAVTDAITDVKLAVHQNVQEKLGYDKLMTQLALM